MKPTKNQIIGIVALVGGAGTFITNMDKIFTIPDFVEASLDLNQVRLVEWGTVRPDQP